MKYHASLQLLLAAVAPIKAAFTWQNVHIGGGGGFVPGFVFHPKTKGVAYARTDIGGLYRLNSDDSWTPVTDTLATDANWLVSESTTCKKFADSNLGMTGALMP